MFFLLSKTLGVLVTPHYLALLLLGIVLCLRLLQRAPRWRRRLTLFSLAWVVCFSLGAVANLLLLPLESRHSRPARLTGEPGAIVMLAGVAHRLAPGGDAEFNEAADRFVEAVRLAHRHPRAVLVLAGGSSSLSTLELSEATILGELAQQLGLPASRLRVDSHSRNTRENALEARRLLQGIPGPVLLITSAAHMPRAAACFARIGQPVIPWPVDTQLSSFGPLAFIPKPESLFRSADALHEYAGLLAYWVAGYL